ncbi:MAG: hypothetical protein LPK38_02445 [Actinomycetes bacterium]|nr:hypothetical protein [Actinomycetes bacterium]MDX5380161.1 hypothetical protein [Actinomycetes bacterium]MDX5398808.1 hypothetical protein [Actinomycetes bacterium]MDX5449877.1 hypothetical protein [Actinomycetes bacterium]
MLDKASRTHLKSLNKENSDLVARHLVAAGQYLDTDPELAHQHALAAQRRAGRIDVVREAVAITAYHTGRYADALREARTVRRLSGDDTLRAIEADSERGLGRPERALAVIAEVELAHQPAHARTELAIVASGARADLGESEAGLLVIEDALRFIRDEELRARLLSVKADRLDELGRTEEAEEVRELLAAEPSEETDSVLYIDDAFDEELALAVDLEMATAEAAAQAEETRATPSAEDDSEDVEAGATARADTLVDDSVEGVEPSTDEAGPEEAGAEELSTEKAGAEELSAHGPADDDESGEGVGGEENEEDR